MFLQQKRFFKNPNPFTEQEEQAEEPDQRCQSLERIDIIRHEKIRLLVLFASSLTLLLGFLSFLIAHTIVILFASLLLVSTTYARLDGYLRNCERRSSS